ncbi:MAG TPA: hypothetical protein VLH79_00490, partial [Chthonomonadales bacterium]|nr:hypothetical protein [Chthonomonadales bacterium]
MRDPTTRTDGGKARRRRRPVRLGEALIERAIFIGGIAAIILVLMIFVFVFREAFPLLREYSLWRFLTGRGWQPTLAPPTGPWFGLLPNLWGSVLVTAGAVAIAVPLGVATAFYISEIASRTVRDILKPVVELLATVPSVAIGFVGAAA